MGFAEEKFLEVAQEINNIQLDGYEFLTESVKQSVECKIYRKYDMVSGCCRTMGGWRGRKRVTYDRVLCQQEKKIGWRGEDQKQKTPWVVLWNESEQKWMERGCKSGLRHSNTTQLAVWHLG